MPKIRIEVERATETSPGAILEGHYDLVDDKVRGNGFAGSPHRQRRGGARGRSSRYRAPDLTQGETGPGRFLLANYAPPSIV